MLFFTCVVVSSQNLEITRQNIEYLSSEKFGGRGYVDSGAKLSAKFLADQLHNYEVSAFGDNYFQYFYYSVNTFPSEMSVKIDNVEKKPGIDYIVHPAGSSAKGKFVLFRPDSLLLNDTIKILEKIFSNREKYSEKILVVDFEKIAEQSIRRFYLRMIRLNLPGFKGFVELLPGDLVWGVRRFQLNHPVVKIKNDAFPDDAKILELNIFAEFIPEFTAKNVIGYIPGNRDEYIVFTAHYDHIGKMGSELYFPGANDNASGTAMLIDFARHYSQKTPEYSIVFMFFFGEEAGLLGSKHYVKNPYFDLDKIKVLINLDLVGTGCEGITIVNGATEGYEKIYQTFLDINLKRSLFSEISAGGEAANSDHHPFHEKGVKSIFIYTRGPGTYYHHIKDTPETLSLAGYENLFTLIDLFIKEYE